MITSTKTPEGEIVQTMELRGYDSVELWRAVFAHCSELETYLRQNRHHLQKGAIESVQARINTYQKLLKDLNVLSNQVE